MKKDYYGTERITAWPQEKGGMPGYTVESSTGNMFWVLKDKFESAYQPITAMSFGHAIEALKAGKKVARAGWNGKGMWLELQVPDDHSKMTLPYLFVFTACKNRVPWLASQTDVLANDWQVVDER